MHQITTMPPAIPRITRGDLVAQIERTKTPVGRIKSHKFRAQDFVRKRQNESLTDHYTIGKLLGDGQFGEVFVGIPKQKSGGKGEKRAIKRIQKALLTEEDYVEVFNEFTTLKQMDHPNICKMYEFFEDNDNFWFVQELCGGGELLDELERIETFTEAEAALIMKQVLSCVHYCHSQKKVVHRDLKLENVLLQESSRQNRTTGESYNPMIVKIIDFGLATTFTEGQILTSPVGSLHYIAPEVLEQEYGPKCDIWSCGVIAYILLCGFAPFEAANEQDIRELIVMGHISFKDPIWTDTISKEARDFVSYLMTYEADKRPDAAQALKHSWIQNAHKAHAEQFKANKSGTDAAVRALNYCRSFESASKLKQATCAFMTSQLVLSGGQEEEEKTNGASNASASSATTNATALLMGEIFRAMDLDSDGRLSREELGLGFLDFLGESADLTNEEVDDIFQRMDMSSTGYIDYSEFVVAAIGLHDQTQSHHQDLLKQAFQRLLDKDGSGYISHEKLRKEMTPFYGEDVEEAIIRKIIDQVDEDKDGQISWEDFQTMMSKKANFVPPEDSTPLGRIKAKKQDVRPKEKEPASPTTNTSKESEENAPVVAKAEFKENSQVDADAEESKENAQVEAEAQNPAIASAPTSDKLSDTLREKLSDNLLAVSTGTPPTPARRLRASVGPKARLITALFESNLAKNRAMGFEAFQYTPQPKLSTQKRKLPRTRRLNFEELTKKATTKIDFDAKAKLKSRKQEIEQMATPGRARERRATLVSMFHQEKEESRTRKESRLRELEKFLKGRTQTKEVQEMVRRSFQEANTRKLELQQRAQRSEELKRLRALIAEESAAKKRLFEMWNKNNFTISPSIAESRPLMMRELKLFQESLDQPGSIRQKFAKSRPPLQSGTGGQRQRRRVWTKHLSGKSLLRDAIEEASIGSSGHERRALERTSSHVALQYQEQEGRLIEMQPNSDPPENAKLIEPLRRLNSFDSEQEDDERDQRLEEMMTEKSTDEFSEHHDMEFELLKLPDDTNNLPPVRGRLASYDVPSQQKNQRLQELRQENGLRGAKTSKTPGMVKSASLHFAKMNNSFVLEKMEELSTKMKGEGETTFEKLNKSMSHTTSDREARRKELRAKSDLDSSIQSFEKLNSSMNEKVMDPQREARLEELKQLKKQKSGRAKFAKEQYEEQIQANARDKFRSQSFIVGSGFNPSEIADFVEKKPNRRSSISWPPEAPPRSANGAERNPGKHHSVMWPPEGKNETEKFIPGSLELKDDQKPDGQTDPPKGGTLGFRVQTEPMHEDKPEAQTEPQHDDPKHEEESKEMNDNSMVDLEYTGIMSHSAREGDSQESFTGSVNNLSASAILEDKPEIIVSPRSYIERPAPRDPNKFIITPKNLPRLGPSTPVGHRKKRNIMHPKFGRRSSASAAMSSYTPGLSEAQVKFQEMAKERAMKAKAKEYEADIPEPGEEVDPAISKD